jgi:hypothetical protein
MNENQYTLTITTTGERDLSIEILDEQFSIQQVASWLKEGGAEGFNPVHDYPVRAEDWAGSIVHDGKVIARYTIEELDERGEVEEIYSNETEDERTQAVEQ